MKASRHIKRWIDHQRNFLRESRVHALLYRNFSGGKELSDKVFSDMAPVFVLSTGRCGTEYLTELFSLDAACAVYHEPEPELLYQGKLAYEHREDASLVRGLILGARYDLIRNAHVQQKRYIETNNRITFFASALEQCFPRARFIHVVRNPVSFVRSGLGRGWYEDRNITEEGRITSSQPGWEALSPAEKIAWLWNETNQFIEDFKEKAPSEKVMTVRSEDLFGNRDTIARIASFAEVDILNSAQLEKIVGKKVNRSRQTSPAVSKEELEAAVAKQCLLRSEYYK